MLRNQPTITSIRAIIEQTSDKDKETTMPKTTKTTKTTKPTSAKTPKAAKPKATPKPKAAKPRAAKPKNPQVKALNAAAKQAAAKQAKPKATPKADTPKLTGAAYLMDKLNKRTAYIAAHSADKVKIVKATNKFTGADLCADDTNAYFISLFIKVKKYRSHKFATIKQAAKNGLKLKDGAQGVDVFYTNRNNKLAYYTVYNVAEFVAA